MLDLEFFQLTDTGRQREHNEDCLGYFQPANEDEARARGWLFVLADGVGGQEQGEVASRLAVDTVVEEFARAARGDALTAVLPKIVQSANAKIYEATTSASAGGTSMATTVVACALRFDRVTVAHAGDSRCYLVRQGTATALTRDHTVAAEQLRLGLITAGEARAARNSHILSRSLGSNMFVNVETSEQQLLPGDVLLQCSDGLHHSLAAGEIAQMAGTGKALEQAARELIDLANERDGSDNISVQLVSVKAVERVGMYRGRHYKLY